MIMSYYIIIYFMSTISVPLNNQQMSSLETLVKNGFAENKAAAMRRALEKVAEDEAVNAVLQAEQEFRDGKILQGDIRDLMKKLS